MQELMTGAGSASAKKGLGAEALSAALTTFFPGHILDLGSEWKDFRGQVGVRPLNKIHLVRARYGGVARVKLTNLRHFMQGFPIHGSAEVVNNGVVTITSPEFGGVGEPGELTFSTEQEFQHNVMLIDSESVSKIVAALIGAPLRAPLRLDRSAAGSQPDLRLSRGLVKMLIEELDSRRPGPSPLVIAEIEQAILVAFVMGNSHNYSRALNGNPPDPAPRQIRLAEEYIAANWNQPISIEALAVLVGVSSRSIFNAFRVHRGYSPMSFLKKLRLEHARDMLRRREFPTTVTSVAFACGFGNLGHFTHDYQRVFGENPSMTLRRANGRSGSQV